MTAVAPAVSIRPRVAVVQVGDLGHGFLDPRTAADAGDFFPEHADACGFIRGNHDDPEICRASPGWIPDGHHAPAWDIMFVDGAFSVDRKHRTEGLDWWEDEECSIAELNAIVDRYIAVKPRIMVTHDALASLAELQEGPTTVAQMPARQRQHWQCSKQGRN